MDIGSLSIAMSQSSLQTQVGAALLKMSMDTTENVAANLTEMMGAVDPNLGNVIDIKA